jgi:hypothetical protein
MKIVRNILAVVVGLLIANVVNMALINLGHSVVALPAGADVSSMQSLKIAMQSFGPEQFIFPFLAHAVGTLLGALVATLIAASHKLTFAMVIGIVSLLGGVAAGIWLGAPLWYDAVDFIFAYIPMAWIGAKLGGAGRVQVVN